MAQMKLFCTKEAQTTFIVTDENGRDTFLVINTNTDDEKRNFLNELIIDHLYMLAHDQTNVSWMEIDTLIAKIKRSGVVFI
jgi:hypothetical protein